MPRKSKARDARRQADETARNLHAERRKVAQKLTTTAEYRRKRGRRIAGYSLVVLGLVMAAFHVITHLGNLQFMPSTGWQDVTVGYPMAGLLFVGGLVLTGSMSAGSSSGRGSPR